MPTSSRSSARNTEPDRPSSKSVASTGNTSADYSIEVIDLSLSPSLAWQQVDEARMGSPTQRQLQDALANLQRQNQELRDQNSALKRDHATNWRMLYDNMKNYPSTKYGDTRVLRTAVMRDISVFSLSNLVPMLTEAPNSIKDGLDALNRLFDEHRDTFALNLREGPRRRFYALRLRAGGRLAQWLDTVYVDRSEHNQLVQCRASTSQPQVVGSG